MEIIMENLAKIVNQSITKKIIGTEYILIILGLFTFTDIFLYIKFEINIINITYVELRDKSKIFDIFQYILWLTFLYALMSKFLLSLYEYFDSTSYTINEMDVLRNDSVLNNNSAGYTHYLNKVIEINYYKLLKKVILIDILLLLIDSSLTIFSDKNNTILELFYISDNKYYAAFIDLIFIFILATLFFFMRFFPTKEHNMKIDIDKFKEINKQFWLNEISLNLIDKTTMLAYLQLIIKSNKLFSHKQALKDTNYQEAFKYCQHYELLIYNAFEDKIKLTSKGTFFSHYVLDQDPFQ